MSGTKGRASTLHIDAGLNAQRVTDIHGAIVAAVDRLARQRGTQWTAQEIAEALLCDLCQIFQGAPDPEQRFALTNNAFEFITRNFGGNPFELLVYRASLRRGPVDSIGATEGEA